MAAAAESAVQSTRTANQITVVDFSHEQLKAPFVLRCAAFCVDYMILLLIPIGWLLLGRSFGETSVVSIGPTVWGIGILVFLLNFILLPLIRGKTIGKMVLGLTIVNSDGTDLRLLGLLRRNILGYIATALTLGIGFLISAVNTSGRSLHDFIGGTIVVRGRKV